MLAKQCHKPSRLNWWFRVSAHQNGKCGNVVPVFALLTWIILGSTLLWRQATHRTSHVNASHLRRSDAWTPNWSPRCALVEPALFQSHSWTKTNIINSPFIDGSILISYDKLINMSNSVEKHGRTSMAKQGLKLQLLAKKRFSFVVKEIPGWWAILPTYLLG